jgi:dTDP-4-amino-4,6-dideoxygalactose transaminase
VFFRFVVSVPRSASSVAERLRTLGVIARRPVYRPLHVALGSDGFPGTAHAFRHALSLPLYPALTSRDEAVVVHALQRVFE